MFEKRYSHSSVYNQAHYLQMLYLKKENYEIKITNQYYGYPTQMEWLKKTADQLHLYDL